MTKFIGDPLEPWLMAPLLNLIPNHSRTSCSDNNTSNGYRHYEGGGVRCNRCALLSFLRGEIWDLIELDVDVTARWVID